ncbi:Hypothetical predicted protein [Cloeon dipterum]|uniref:Peptidase S1 domain-containing protein n=1 Tax=Cloeon dipterum TaxID=197152 RepID=A0A8S1CUC1_9INSE|nr:Hypothetical predicted protein [Cloeon dipterum]
MFNILVLLYSLFLLKANAKILDGLRIVNGKEVPELKYPSLVSIQDSGYHICGAAILNKNYVLTAAHCVDSSRDIEDLKVVSSVTNLKNKKSRKYKVTKIEAHEKYNVSDLIANDIAVEPKFILQDGEAVAELPGNGETLPTGAIATAVGWGRKVHLGPGATTLQETDMRVLNSWDCSDRIGKIHTTQFCTDSPKSGICEGDSGSPLLANGKVFGITSWRDGNKPCGQGVGVYTQVSYYLDWIKQHASE